MACCGIRASSCACSSSVRSRSASTASSGSIRATSSAACAGSTSRSSAVSSSRLHLLQRVRGEVVVQAGQQLLPARPAQLFQHVRELGGPQPAQRRVRLAQLHRGRRLRRVGAERLDRGPVDDPVRGRMPAEALGAEPAQQRLQADVHAHQLDLVADLGEVQVGGPDHLHLVGVHQLVIEDVAVPAAPHPRAGGTRAGPAGRCGASPNGARPGRSRTRRGRPGGAPPGPRSRSAAGRIGARRAPGRPCRRGGRPPHPTGSAPGRRSARPARRCSAGPGGRSSAAASTSPNRCEAAPSPLRERGPGRRPLKKCRSDTATSWSAGQAGWSTPGRPASVEGIGTGSIRRPGRWCWPRSPWWYCRDHRARPHLLQSAAIIQAQRARYGHASRPWPEGFCLRV